MKHIIHSIASRHLLCSVYNDDDTLIIGNHVVDIPADFDSISMDTFFTDKVYPSIESMLNPVVSDKTQIEASPVLIAMESAKELIKWDLIRQIKNNNEITLDELIAYTESTHGWENSGLVLKMLSEYILLAAQKELVELTDNSKDYYFAVLKQIIINSSDEQLRAMLD